MNYTPPLIPGPNPQVQQWLDESEHWGRHDERPGVVTYSDHRCSGWVRLYEDGSVLVERTGERSWRIDFHSTASSVWVLIAVDLAASDTTNGSKGTERRHLDAHGTSPPTRPA